MSRKWKQERRRGGENIKTWQKPSLDLTQTKVTAWMNFFHKCRWKKITGKAEIKTTSNTHKTKNPQEQSFKGLPDSFWWSQRVAILVKIMRLKLKSKRICNWIFVIHNPSKAKEQRRWGKGWKENQKEKGEGGGKEVIYTGGLKNRRKGKKCLRLWLH